MRIAEQHVSMLLFRREPSAEVQRIVGASKRQDVARALRDREFSWDEIKEIFESMGFEDPQRFFEPVKHIPKRMRLESTSARETAIRNYGCRRTRGINK